VRKQTATTGVYCPGGDGKIAGVPVLVGLTPVKKKRKPAPGVI